MPLPPPAGAAANNAKLVVTLILYLPATADPSDGSARRRFRWTEACKTDLSPGIVLASWCFRLRPWNLKSLI